MGVSWFSIVLVVLWGLTSLGIIMPVKDWSVGTWVLVITGWVAVWSGVGLFFGGNEYPSVLAVISWLFGISPGVVIWFLCNHKYPGIQSIPKTKMSQCSAGDFTWVGFNQSGIPNWVISEWLESVGSSSGLIWEGFSVGVSKETGKVGSIAVWLYASNEGVGHYVYMVRVNRFNSAHGEGHFNMLPYGDARRRDRAVGREALAMVASDVGMYYRPLQVSYTEETAILEMYDDESGRNVSWNHKRVNPRDDLFVFGPYPKVDYVPVKDPGLTCNSVELSDGVKKLSFCVQDVCGRALNHTLVVMKSDTGWAYQQVLPDDLSYAVICIPDESERVQVKVTRGGYGELNTELKTDVMYQRIDVVLKPLR